MSTTTNLNPQPTTIITSTTKFWTNLWPFEQQPLFGGSQGWSLYSGLTVLSKVIFQIFVIKSSKFLINVKSRNCLLFSLTLWRVKFRRFEYFFVFVNSPNWFFNFKITLFILIIINIADGVDKCSEIFLFNFSFLLWQYVDWVQTN